MRRSEQLPHLFSIVVKEGMTLLESLWETCPGAKQHMTLERQAYCEHCAENLTGMQIRAPRQSHNNS